MSSSDQLTDPSFWDAYWANCPLPSMPDVEISFDRCLMRKFREVLTQVGNHLGREKQGAAQKAEALEIGCAPGKWLVFLQQEFGFNPNGIEYSPAGVAATRRNFELLKINSGRLWTGDFFAIPPEPRFDLVYSLGFIEHFTDIDLVVTRHLEWVKPGGFLILGVPNFRGIHGFFQGILDPDVLSRHNLRIMSPEKLRETVENAGGKTYSVGRIGSFEPTLPIRRPGFHRLDQVLVKTFLRIMEPLRHSGWFENIAHRRLSCYLFGVFQRSGISP